MAAKGIGRAAQKVQEISRAVQESLGPTLSKVSGGLGGTIQGISGAIGGAAGGAKRIATSSWEWAKREVEERRK